MLRQVRAKLCRTPALQDKVMTPALKHWSQTEFLEGHNSAQFMLPSRAIKNVLFPTYEVVITSLSHSSALMSERIKCSIPLVDNHINIHRAIHAVC